MDENKIPGIQVSHLMSVEVTGKEKVPQVYNFKERALSKITGRRERPVRTTSFLHLGMGC